MTQRLSTLVVLTNMFSVVFLLTGSSSALAHSGIFVTDVGGQVAVGDARPNEADFNVTSKVFGRIMFASYPPYAPKDCGADHPGFFALGDGLAGMPAGASALPGEADANLNIASFSVEGSSDTLFYWDGSGAVDFQPITIVQPDVTLTVDPINPLYTTAENGALHVHPAFGLDDGGAGVPADGIYLISPTISVEGLVDSDAFHILWLVDSLITDEETAEEVDESLEAGQMTVLGKNFGFFPEAVEYVQQNLAVPEPSSALMSIMALAGVSGYLVRRRQG